MRFNKWGVLGVSAFALVGVVGGAVVAKTTQDAKAGAGELRVMALGSVFSPGFFDRLDLSESQRTQIREILRDNRGSFIPLLAAAHTSGKALREAAASGASADDLQPLATKQADADTAVIAAVIQTESQVAGVLTADQRSQAAKLLDARIATIRRHVEAGDGPIAAAPVGLGDKLNLTADQKTQARQIIASSRAVTKPQTLQLLDRLASTEDAIATGSYDPATAQTDASRSAGSLATVVLTAATTREHLYALLTPDQKAQLQGIMAR